MGGQSLSHLHTYHTLASASLLVCQCFATCLQHALPFLCATKAACFLLFPLPKGKSTTHFALMPYLQCTHGHLQYLSSSSACTWCNVPIAAKKYSSPVHARKMGAEISLPAVNCTPSEWSVCYCPLLISLQALLPTPQTVDPGQVLH